MYLKVSGLLYSIHLQLTPNESKKLGTSHKGKIVSKATLKIGIGLVGQEI